MNGQFAICNGDFDFSAPREFAAVAARIGRVPLVPQYGAVYRVARLWSAPGGAAPYLALAEEPSGLGYRADWFWFVSDPARIEIARLDAIAHRPVPDDARAKTSLLALVENGR